MILKNKYKLVVAYIFFFFLTAPILSPYVNGVTIYIFWFIPFLDIYFIKNIFKMKYNKKISLVFYLAITFILILQQYIVALELILMVITIMYLFYAKESGTFKALYNCIIINIIIAIIQFILIYIDPAIAQLIGPTNIANLVWGQYSTPTYTNFFAVFTISRVSGLSREAGFFSSLLGVTFMIYILDKDIIKNKFKILIFIIGFIISFSKVTIIFIPIFIIIKMKKIINKVPLILGVGVFVLAMVLISNKLLLDKYYDNRNESITHRISGYTIMSKMKVSELISGVDSMNDITNIDEYWFVNTLGNKFDKFAGLSSTVIHNGLLIFILFIFGLYLCNISTAGFLVITLITFTTTYSTSAAHVVLGYFIIFYYKDIV